MSFPGGQTLIAITPLTIRTKHSGEREREILTHSFGIKVILPLAKLSNKSIRILPIRFIYFPGNRMWDGRMGGKKSKECLFLPRGS